MFFDHDVMQRSTQHADKTKFQVSWGLVKTENACACTFYKKRTNIISRASFCNFFFTASNSFLNTQNIAYVVQCFEMFPAILYCNFLQLFRFLRATFYCNFYQVLRKT